MPRGVARHWPPPPNPRKGFLVQSSLFSSRSSQTEVSQSQGSNALCFPTTGHPVFPAQQPGLGASLFAPPPFHRSHPHSHAHSVSGNFDGVACFEGLGCHFKPMTEEKYQKGNLPGGEITRGFSGFIQKRGHFVSYRGFDYNKEFCTVKGTSELISQQNSQI